MTMIFTRCIALAFLCALFSFPADAAGPNSTSAQYTCTNGSLCTGSVMQQSPDGINAAPVNAQNPLQVSGSVVTQPQANSTTNISGTVTAGGTFQTIAAANTSRKAFEFQNICNIAGKCANTTDVCYLYFGTLGSATTSNSIALAAGASYLRSQGSIPTDAANATCTTTGDAFAGDVQ